MTHKEIMTKVLTEHQAAKDNPQLALEEALKLLKVSEKTAWQIALYRLDILRFDRLWRQIQEQNKDLAGSKRTHRKEVLAPEKQRELGYNTKKQTR